MGNVLTRRSMLAGTAAGAFGLALAGSGVAAATTAGEDTEFAALERQYDRRLGVWAVNVRTGRTVRHREDERFPMCSVFKTLLAAKILRDLPGRTLDRRVTWTAADVVVNSPVTEVTVRNGLTVAQLAEAAVTRSDNTAANLLMRLTGGPAGVTAFARSIGDDVTRLDRWEPELNTAVPGDVRDTTTPRAIAGAYRTLLLGDALGSADRGRLITWMLANQTTGKRFGAGVPAAWRLADKTGGGDYGSRTDVGVAWTPKGEPIVIAALTHGDADPAMPGLDTPLADIAASACRRLA